MAPTIQDASSASRTTFPRNTQQSASSYRRPATIAELADAARETGWDAALPLKHWLKVAEKVRAAGNQHIDQGDLEMGFVELARAATIVMEKVPTHKDYQSLLNATLRKNLGSVSL